MNIDQFRAQISALPPDTPLILQLRVSKRRNPTTPYECHKCTFKDQLPLCRRLIDAHLCHSTHFKLPPQ